MTSLSRRNFLAAIGSTAASAAAFASTLKTVGVQLYTVRSIIDDKPLETLKALDEIGYREAEVIMGNMEKIWPSLQQTKLKPVSLHMDTQLFTVNQAQLPAALESAKKHGMEYVVCPYIAPKDRGGADVMKRLGETLNKAGQTCSSMGLQLCYHNHAFEFESSGSTTLLDILLGATDPKLVQLELDIMWAQVGGPGAIAVLKQYKGRIPLMHVKNVAAGTAQRFNESVPKTAFAEVGKGMIDVAAVLKAAGPAGVKHYFVEQDQTSGNPLDSLRGSFDYLHKLNF
jgi:sugar phosphate isomerase/epimerase